MLTYDAANRIKTLTNANSEVTTWSYDDAGRLTQQDMANLTKATYTYDNADRLTGLTNSKSDDTVISSFTYTYYDAGGKKTVTESGGAITTYTYDEADRLTREQRTVANAYDYQYTYDYVGNRLTMVDGGTSTTTYSYDVANQLTVKVASDLSRTTYSYDNNGNLTQTNASGSVTTYTWDYENRMLTDTLPTSAVTTFTYDGDGLRRQTQTATATTKFILDGQDVLLETNGGGTTQVVYTQTPDMYGNTISQRRGTTSAFYHYDALGSTSELTDASQNVTDTNRYHAFGSTLASTGSTTNAYGYVGKQGYYNESSLGLQYLRARWYDPSLGRFVSEDPIGMPQNYVYVSDNPLGFSDPSGKACSPYGPSPTLKAGPCTVSSGIMYSSFSLEANFGMNWYVPGSEKPHDCAVYQYWKGRDYQQFGAIYTTPNWTPDKKTGWPYPFTARVGGGRVPWASTMTDSPIASGYVYKWGNYRLGMVWNFLTCLCGTNGSVYCYTWTIDLEADCQRGRVLSCNKSGPTSTSAPFKLPAPCGVKPPSPPPGPSPTPTKCKGVRCRNNWKWPVGPIKYNCRKVCPNTAPDPTLICDGGACNPGY